MLIAFLATVSFGAVELQAAPQAQTIAPEGRAVPAAPAAQEPAPRQVCRFETTIGSNRRVRVCREASPQSVQDQATREFMRDHQRIRTPDGG